MSTDDPNNQAIPPDPGDPHAPGERRLWRSLAGSSASDDCPAALDLAAYVDDRLPAPERASLETHLAECSDCRMALEETREIIAERGDVLPLVPGEVIRAAKSLVEPLVAPMRRPARRPAGPTRLRFPSIWSFARAGVAAAASIAICIAGYRAGAASSTSLSSAASGEVDLSAEMSFGLLDPAQDEAQDYDLFAIAIEREEESP